MYDLHSAPSEEDPAAPLDSLLDICRNILSQEQICVRPGASERTSGSGSFRSRHSGMSVFPSNIEQVRELLRAFHKAGGGEDKGGAHLYPVSTGYNWGFGTAQSVKDGAVRLELRALDTIRELDLDSGVAVVEPGVSQGRLAEELLGSPYMLNVTASSSRTSIIGNALDRGIGLRRQRTEDLIGLEVVLADGTLLHVGRWPRPELATTPYAQQVGPGLLQLFVQSGLGVVTGAALRLIPRTEALSVVRLRFGTERLRSAISYLMWAHRNRLTTGLIKIFSPDATAAYGGGAPGRYHAYVCVTGTPRVVESIVAALTDEATRVGAFDDWHLFGPDEPGESVSEQAALRGYAGDPTANDAMVTGIFGTRVEDIETLGVEGWLFFVPVVPFTPSGIEEAVRLLQRVAAEAGPGLTVGHTLNVLPEAWVDMVVSIRFARIPESAARAQQLLDRLHLRFSEAGFHPYRLDIDHMESAPALRGDTAQDGLLCQLKALLDPHDVLLRGRYAGRN